MAPIINIKTHPPSSCADTGSDSILLRQADAVAATLDIQPTRNPLHVRFPDGQTARSIGITTVALPSTDIPLPAHIFTDDDLRQSLFGIADITNLDYDATFRKNGLYLYHGTELVHYTSKSLDDTSWTLPIQRPLAHANAVLSLPSNKKFTQFTHAAFGSPSISTLLRALRKGYLSTLPRLTSALLCKHSPNTEATAMGHLDRTRQGLDSTTAPTAPPQQPITSPTTYEDDIHNLSDSSDAIMDTDPTVYTKLFHTADFDLSGRFPVPSAGARYTYHLVTCFNGNIHVEPMSSRTSGSYILAYDNTYQHWAQYGPVPSIVRLDNETSADLEKFLLVEKKVTSFQYFPPRNHRANRAKRCIRTWKNHFIATLATASPKFPVQQWHKLIPLAEITLNCLLPWQPNPAISAYHGLTGAKFDFRAHPIAPAGTAILIHEPPETRGTWAGHGVPGFYLGPALHHYRSHHVYVTATSAPRVTDTIAWFPETAVTPPPPDTHELLIAAIKYFLTAIQKYNLTGELLPPTLVQDLQDLASLHNAPPPLLAAQVPVPAPAVQEQRVPPIVAEPVQEQRVVLPLDIVQEPRVALPTLAAANPVLTAPLAPTSIVALLPCPYPPPPGLPPLPATDNPNHLMGAPITSSTVPVAVPRRTSRPHTIRSPSSFGYSSVTIPESYIEFEHAFSAPILTKSEVSALLAASDAAWLTTIDHLAQANAAAPLNVNPDGSPLTFQTAKRGAERPNWQDAEDFEIDRLIDTTTMHGIHLAQQPLDRRSDTTYYNPKPKEKYDDDMSKVYRIRCTAGGDRINYDGPTKANTAAMPTVKILLQSVVSDNANFMTLDIKDFYLMTPLPRPEYIRIPLKFLSQKVLDKHNLQQFVHNNSVLFE